MPKYYVYSKDFQSVIDAPTPKEGAVMAFRRDFESLGDGQLSPITMISERGMESYEDDDRVIATKLVLDLAGLSHLFEDCQ